MSCYLHQVPGRIRIKTPIIKGKPYLAQVVEEKLGMLSGICSVRVNCLTGSILINYDEHEMKSAAILCLVEKECGLDLSAASSVRQGSAKPTETDDKIGEKVGKAILAMVIEQVFEGSPLTLLCAVI